MSIRTVRNINVKNETHSWMMNEWIRIWHELSSGSPVFHEGERKWSNFCLFSDWFWLMSACDYWCLTIFPAWFGVTVAVFRLSLSVMAADGRNGLFILCMNADVTSRPRMMRTTEPEMNAYCKSLCQSSQHLRQVLRRLSKYSLRMMLYWVCFFVFFPLLCSQCVNTQQPCSSFTVLTVSVLVRGSGLCCLILIRINHIRIRSGSACGHVPPFFVTPISWIGGKVAVFTPPLI